MQLSILAAALSVASAQFVNQADRAAQVVFEGASDLSESKSEYRNGKDIEACR